MEKIAIIELNEKALKLSIYLTSEGKHKLCMEREQYFPVGKEIVGEELLSPKTKIELLNVLKIYRKLVEQHGVKRIFAITDDTILRARNYRGFLDEVYNNTGLNFVILNDEDFCKAIFNGVVNSIDNAKGVFIYVGAYKTYMAKYNRRTILASSVINVGYRAEGEEEGMDKVEKIVKAELNRSSNEVFEQDCNIVGVGSPFINIGRISKKLDRYPLDIDNNYPLTKESCQSAYDFIKGLDREKIRKIKGLGNEDADKIARGSAIINAIFGQYNLKEITISNTSLRAGILFQNVLSQNQERFNDLLANSLDNFYEFSKDEFSTNVGVYNMALILYKQLKVMHKLPRFYVKPLRIAAYMYDAGKSINQEDFTKYSLEKIVNCGINGVTHRELLIAGFIAVCQNLDDFSLNEWIKYKGLLTEEDLDAVRKLGVIIKLAVAFNISGKPVVQDIECDILGDSIIMKTVTETDATYEIMEGMKVAPDYKKIYKKSLQII